MKLTLDIGGSKTRVFLYTESGTERLEIHGGFGKVMDSEDIECTFFSELKTFLGDKTELITAVAVNLGGKNKEQITRTVSQLCPLAKVFIRRESEGVLARRIMQMYDADILIMAGTGCIVFSVSKQGERVLGGWGKDYGDDGSGYSIGIKAVRYALKDLDGGAKETSLITKALLGVESAFRFRNIDEYAAVRDAARDKIPKTREGIAALTKTVVACAEKGCALSKQVLNETGEELAELVLTAIRADGIQNPTVAINGGVTNFSHLWKDAFLARLQQKGQTVNLVCFNDGIDKALKEIAKEL